MVTNGIIHYYCKVNDETNNIKLLDNFPSL